MNTTMSLAVAAFALLLAVAGATWAAPPQETAEAIRTHRMGTLLVKAKPGEKVKVTQLRHEFWFGTALSRKMFRDATPADQRE
ncbi:MAG: glycoside hydrolase, partial [Planctomycetes bacterium]|nr:glycoside hydrolase [Planctomycetota bacterium]